jgi:hypothetical protein
MALEEKTVLDMASWRPEFATIEVRMANLILRDGVEISKEYHRHVVPPEQTDVSGEHPDVQELAATYAAERSTKAADNAAKAAEEENGSAAA